MKSMKPVVRLFPALCATFLASATAAETADQLTPNDRIEAAMFGLLPNSEGWECTRSNDREAKSIATSAAPAVMATCQLGMSRIVVVFVFNKNYASIQRFQIDGRAKSKGAAITRFFENGPARLMSTSEGFEGVLGDLIVVKANGLQANAGDPEPIEALDALANVLTQRDTAGLIRDEDVVAHERDLSARVDEVRRRTRLLFDMIAFPEGVIVEPSPETEVLQALPDLLSAAWLPAASRVGSIGGCRILVAVDGSSTGVKEAHSPPGWISKRIKDGETRGPYKYVRRERYVEREFLGHEIAALINEKVYLKVVFLAPDLCTDKIELLRRTFDMMAAKDFSKI